MIAHTGTYRMPLEEYVECVEATSGYDALMAAVRAKVSAFIQDQEREAVKRWAEELKIEPMEFFQTYRIETTIKTQVDTKNHPVLIAETICEEW